MKLMTICPIVLALVLVLLLLVVLVVVVLLLLLLLLLLFLLFLSLCGWQVKLCDPSLTLAILEHFCDKYNI